MSNGRKLTGALHRLLNLQFVAVALAVLAGAAWSDTRPLKEVAFLVLAGAVSLAALWRGLREGAHEVRLWPFDFLVAAYVVWALLSAAFSPYRWAWVEPALILAGLTGVFAAVRSLGMNAGELKAKLAVICFTAAAVAAFGVLQYLEAWGKGGSPIFHPFATGRVNSTMGNPNLLAAFLNLAFFASLGLLFSPLRAGFGRTAAGSAALVILLLIFHIRSRGALLGLAAGGAVFFVLHLWRAVRAKRFLCWGAAAALSLAAVIGGSIVVSRSVGPGGVEIVDPQRAFIWRASLSMIEARPVTGHGLGRFKVFFPLYQRGRFSTLEVNPVTLHAHSEPIETAVETGLVGCALLAAAVALFAWAAVSGMRRLEEKDTLRRALAAGGLAALAAVLAQSLISVNTRWIQVSYPAVFTAGLVAAALRRHSPARLAWQYSLGRRASLVLRALTMCIGAAVIAALSLYAWRIVLSAVHHADGYAARLEAPLHKQPEKAEAAVKRAIEHLTESVSLNPHNVDSWYTLAEVHSFLGQSADCTEALEKVQELSPNYSRSYRMLAENYAKLGRAEAAEAFRKKDRELNYIEGAQGEAAAR